MSKYIDLNYRPNSYFWAYELGINLSSEIKGAERKTIYEESVVKSEESELDNFIQKPSLNELERKLISKAHPSFMGGEFLPDRDFGEVEIARITINSVTQDVTCVLASMEKNQIHYRVVDEYEGETLSEVNEEFTDIPMTLMELTDFFLKTRPLHEVLEMNFGETNIDPEYVKYFVKDASSSFYAQFGDLIELKIDEWLSEKGAL